MKKIGLAFTVAGVLTLPLSVHAEYTSDTDAAIVAAMATISQTPTTKGRGGFSRGDKIRLLVALRNARRLGSAGLDKLAERLISRTVSLIDGCVDDGQPDRNDIVRDCGIQAQLFPAVDAVLNGTPVQDGDGDGVVDADDNCPSDFNEDQADSDADGVGDACDVDADNDSVPDDVDNCPANANSDQSDLDGDGTGDACETDTDGDGVENSVDNCPLDADPTQSDIDADGIGDVCDQDIDGDGVANAADNCPVNANTDQLDTDGDGMGAVCDSEGEMVSISGRVWYDQNEDGIQQSTEGALDTEFNSKLEVYLVSENNDAILGSSLLDANGIYSITGVPNLLPGTYILAIANIGVTDFSNGTGFDFTVFNRLEISPADAGEDDTIDNDFVGIPSGLPAISVSIDYGQNIYDAGLIQLPI